MSTPSDQSSMAPRRTSTSLRTRQMIGTHELHIDGYSNAARLVDAGESIDSRTFTACGRKWMLCYYPNGSVRKPGPASVMLLLMDHWSKGDVTAACRLSVLDAGRNAACSYVMAPHTYTGGSKFTNVYVLATPEEREAVRRLAKGDSLAIRCEVMVVKVEKESRIRSFLRKLLE